jgi:DNA-binding winged helix-turn-helix (wHTH) protein/tetratricopeptide (TPR) repeat protein
MSFSRHTTMLSFAPYWLDPIDLCLWRAEEGATPQRIEMTPKTFDVLRYLVENSGRLVSHDALLEAVWRSTDVQPDVVKGHILRIRGLLGDNAHAPRFVETVRGRGYRFIARVTAASDALHDAPASHRRGGFVGRADALAEMAAALDRARSGDGQIVFVMGETGAGKTALVEQFLALRAVSSIARVARGGCVEGLGGGEPYYPVLEALGRLGQAPGGSVVTETLISLAPTWAIQMPAQIAADRRAVLLRQTAGAARDRMLHEMCGLLETLSEDKLLVLVIEDLHRGDLSTVHLLSTIGRRLSRSRIMVIATYCPEATEADIHPVKALSHELKLKKLATEVELGPLSVEEVALLLSGERSFEPRNQAFAHLIAQRCCGNPLFILAMLEHLVERGVIGETSQGWQQRAPIDEIDLHTPRTIRQAVEARIQRLNAQQQRLLEAASVAGPRFSAATTAQAAAMSPERFEDMCELLARRHCFIHRAESTVSSQCELVRWYGFDHALFCSVLYDRQGLTRLTTSHRLIGTRIEALYAPTERDEVALELGRHFVACRDWERALGYLGIALQTARRRFAYREALNILDITDKLVAKLPVDRRAVKPLELLESRAVLYSSTHDPRAQEAFFAVVEEAKSLGRVDSQTRSLLSLSYTVGWQEQEQSLKFLDEALRLSVRQTDPQERAATQIHGYARRIWTRGWSVSDAQQCEKALCALREGPDPVTAARGLLEYGMICVVSGRYREAINTLKANYRVLFEYAGQCYGLDIARGTWMVRLGTACSLLYLGELGQSLDEFDTGVEIFRKNGNYYAARYLQICRGLLLLHTMDFEAVIDSCDQLGFKPNTNRDQENVEDGGMLPPVHRACTVLSGLAHLGLGNLEAATRLLAGAEQRMSTRPVAFDWCWTLALQWGLATLALITQDSRLATARAERLVALAEQTEERTWQALAWATLTRAYLSCGDIARADASIVRAMTATEGYEAPVAEWHVQRTAACVHRAAEKSALADACARLAEEKRAVLCRSLGAQHAIGRRLRVADVESPFLIKIAPV